MVNLDLGGHQGSGTARLLIVRGDFYGRGLHLSQPFDGLMPKDIAFVFPTARRLSDHLHDIQLERIIHLEPLITVERSRHVFEDPLRPCYMVAPFSSRCSAVRVDVGETLGDHVNVNAIPVVDGIGIEGQSIGQPLMLDKLALLGHAHVENRSLTPNARLRRVCMGSRWKTNRPCEAVLSVAPPAS